MQTRLEVVDSPLVELRQLHEEQTVLRLKLLFGVLEGFLGLFTLHDIGARFLRFRELLVFGLAFLTFARGINR